MRIHFGKYCCNGLDCGMGDLVRKEEEMIAFTVIMVVLIICISVLAGIYICYCGENEVGMFGGWKYEDRIINLEKEMEELKKE